VSTAEEQGLPASGRSLPQLLKTSGYATALVGKWHLGYKPEFSPNAHGYDYFFGFKSGYIDYYQHTDGAGLPDLFENAAPVQRAGYMTAPTPRQAGALNREDQGEAVLRRSGLQRRALAVPGARQTVGGHRQ